VNGGNCVTDLAGDMVGLTDIFDSGRRSEISGEIFDNRPKASGPVRVPGVIE
jgi:hypothetical protein